MAKPEEINAGDKVLVRQKKCTTKPPFNEEPLTVTNKIGNQLHAIKKNGTARDKNQLKKVKERPQHLCPTWEKSVYLILKQIHGSQRCLGSSSHSKIKHKFKKVDN